MTPCSRQRKALSPAFSNAAIRKLTPVFYDAAYKVRSLDFNFSPVMTNAPRKTKAAWDSALDTGSGEAIIDVQIWYVLLLGSTIRY